MTDLLAKLQALRVLDAPLVQVDGRVYMQPALAGLGFTVFSLSLPPSLFLSL